MSILLNCKCMSGYYETLEKKCEKCMSRCLACEDGSGNCSKCKIAPNR